MKRTKVLQRSYDKVQANAKGRQSKATKGGQAFEQHAITMFSKHPNVSHIETQVFNRDVDMFSNIDMLIVTKSGKRVYVPMAKDLWIGTSQQDRLQAVYYKTRLMSRRVKFAYLCLSDFNDMLNKSFRASARRGPTIKSTIGVLAKEKRLHNADTLWEYLHTI